MNDFREFQKQYNDYLQRGLPYTDDYICHFGILGMKWGVRRYQNPDGTLTAAGKKRYAADRVKDIKKVVASTKAYSKERYEGVNKIIDEHSKHNQPTEEEIKVKNEYLDSQKPFEKSYSDKHEYNKACDLLATTLAKEYHPGDEDSPNRYKAGLAFDDLDQSGEITLAYLVNQGKSKKEIISLMNKMDKAQDEYYNKLKDRCDKIIDDLGNIGDIQVGSLSYQKAKHEITEAIENKGQYDGYNPYQSYLTDTSYSNNILDKMIEIYNNKEVKTMPEVSCHVFPDKYVKYEVGNYEKEYNELMKNVK